MMRNFKLYAAVVIGLIVNFGLAGALHAQTTEFSYQGFLNDNAASANGSFDFEFRLYDAVSGGTLQGTIQRLNITVTNGVFSVSLDFGAAAFPGADRYLEIAVKPTSGGSFTTLAPRQKIGRTPYAITSGAALQAVNSTQLGGLPASQYVLTATANRTRRFSARQARPGLS